MEVGKAGDSILAEIRREMKEESLEGLIYSHPIGDYGAFDGPFPWVAWAWRADCFCACGLQVTLLGEPSWHPSFSTPFESSSAWLTCIDAALLSE